MLIIPLSSLLTGCGYHTDRGEQTLSVPYFTGDTNGTLTDSVIKALAASGNFRYTDKNGSLLLEGTIISDTNENIGYQFDRISNQRIHRLVPNEGRREITVEILLTDTRTQKVVYGPAKISASGDYDFVDSDSLRDTSFINAAGARRSSLFFSMGQLDSINGAQATSLDPIHRRLSLKIIEGISNLPYNAE
ncbi:MAG: hypothetical protein P0S93_06115 [Candidatus Neptunochlamydia sp.]|nr:hypothetical protein [Candidatus Neptunochlamydia sp.]